MKHIDIVQYINKKILRCSFCMFQLCGHFSTMASDKCIDNLPDELLLEIFSNFTTSQLAMTVQHVSCRWKEVSQDNSLWRNRVYSPEETSSDQEILQHLLNMPVLRKFSPKRGVRVKDIINTMCNTCRNIQHLDLMWSRVTVHSLKQILNAFPELTYLNVPLRFADPLKFCTVIGQFKKLTALGFNCIDTNEKFLNIIADECTHLQHLDLGDGNYNDQDIQYFLEKKKHEILSFSVRCYISTRTFIALSECMNLEYLVYGDYNDDLPGTYIHRFSKLSKMKKISFTYYRERLTGDLAGIFVNNAMPCLNVLDILWCDYFEAQTLNSILRNCSGLTELTIRDSSGLDGGFESIGTCSKLKILTLQCYTIPDKCFECIGSGCHELKKLVLHSCNYVTDKAFEYISAGCPLLKHLDIQCLDEITDGIFESLFKCKNLRFLCMKDNMKIAEIPFNDISKYLVHLETLHLAFDNFSEEKIEQLKKDMPQLQVENFNKNVDHEECYSDIDLQDVSLFNQVLF